MIKTKIASAKKTMQPLKHPKTPNKSRITDH